MNFWGAYFTYSAFSPSSPTLFLFVMLLDAFSVSSVVKGVFISAGFMIIGSSFELLDLIKIFKMAAELCKGAF